MSNENEKTKGSDSSGSSDNFGWTVAKEAVKAVLGLPRAPEDVVSDFLKHRTSGPTVPPPRPDREYE